MSRTKQQQAVINAVQEPTNSLVKVKAVAGAGKTFTLVELAKEMNPKKGIYLAYNKAIAEEATQKFKGTNMKCSTIHSLAYSAVVRQYGLKVGDFKVRHVQPAKTKYLVKKRVVDTLEGFCLSDYTDPHSYLKSMRISHEVATLVMEHINNMSNGTIACTHSFYLKYYHVLLTTGEVPIPETDLLMVDEAGDLTMLTIAIFNLIKAKKKIAVGDPMQNIYSFNNTVNAFNVLKEEGIECNLTESFRVSTAIATGVEAFAQKHLDCDFQFKGRVYEGNTPIVTRAYIARNNSGLLEEMLRLHKEGTPFHTTRKITHILELPLILANLGSGKSITDFKYKHIEKARVQWEMSKALQEKYPSISRYVLGKINKEDEEVSRALIVLSKYGPTVLNSLTKFAVESGQKPCNLTLSTAHSSKGLEFCAVEIAPDLNESVTKALVDLLRAKLDRNTKVVDSIKEELRLYYVAVTRAMVELTNAKYIKQSD